MAAKRADVFMPLLLTLIFATFLVKRESFCTPDGISITLYELDLFEGETFIHSTLYITKKSHYFRPRSKSLFCLLLLICGDIEQCPGPYNGLTDNVQQFCRTKGLNIFNLNIRGLQGSFDELKSLLLTSQIDIFALNEIFVNTDDEDENVNNTRNEIFLSSYKTDTEQFEIQGYDFIYKSRDKGTGGGVGVYIRSNLDYGIREDLENPEIESICIEIKPKKSKSWIFCTMYRPPDSSKYLSKNFQTLLENILNLINRENKESMIMGDVNINYLVKDDHKTLKELFNVNGYDQLIKRATRTTKDTATLIDVILTSNATHINRPEVINCSWSDHDIIACCRKLNHIKFEPETIKCRDYSKYNVDTINNELLNIDWSAVYNSACPIDSLHKLSSILKETLDKHAPFITKRIKGKPSPWMTEDLKKHMNTRDQLRRRAKNSKGNAYAWQIYRQKKNFVKNEIIRAKRHHFKNELRENAKNSNKFWKIIKEIFPVKSKSSIIAKSFNLTDGKSTTDKNLISNGFCKFYSNIASRLKEKSFPLKNFIWNYQKSDTRYSSLPNFKFTPVLDTQVLKYLKNLKRKCATGLDDIPACYMKDIAFVVAKPLTHVINLSLSSGIVPNCLKSARVTPIYKSGSNQTFENYRPISILPVISKIYEKCVHKQLMDYLESNHLLAPNQYGYRSKRSTELATAYFCDSIRRSMDDGKLTGAIFVDLSKAFDTIGHSTIINKLPSFGITSTAQDWLASYLFGRHQHVRYKGNLSLPSPIFCGVPQGSILGPLLFLLIFNDSSESLTNCKILTYADDTVIFFSHKNIDVIRNHLQTDFDRFVSWLERNELILNAKIGKTETMLFGTGKRISMTENTSLNVTHNDKVINQTETYKYLGLSLTCTLCMSQYITSSIKKASSRLNLLRKMRTFIDSDTALTIYRSMILPLITNCTFATYGATANYLKERTVRLENRATRIIGTEVNNTNTIKVKRICSFVHQCLYGKVCEPFQAYFKLRKNVLGVRNHSYVVVPRFKLESARYGFYVQGALAFNSLPVDFQKEKDESKFKSFLKNY